jgi:hypothetical protein
MQYLLRFDVFITIRTWLVCIFVPPLSHLRPKLLLARPTPYKGSLIGSCGCTQRLVRCRTLLPHLAFFCVACASVGIIGAIAARHEPGWKACFASCGPGWGLRSDIQPCAGCIAGAWPGRMQSSNHALHLLKIYGPVQQQGSRSHNEHQQRSLARSKKKC